MNSVDAIIIGAGPAGITIANALSESASVLLIDKGSPKRQSLNDIPILAGEKIQKLKSISAVKISENHSSIINESFGGNSEINGLVHYLGYQKLFEAQQMAPFSVLKRHYADAVKLSDIKLQRAYQTEFDRTLLEYDFGVDKDAVLYRTNSYFRSKYKLKKQVSFLSYTVKPKDIKNLGRNVIDIDGKTISFKTLIFCVSPCAFLQFQPNLISEHVGKLYDHVNMRIRISNPCHSINLNRGIGGFTQKLKQVFRFSVGANSLLRGVGPTSFHIVEYGTEIKKYFKLQILWFHINRVGGRFERGKGTDISFSITPFNPFYASKAGTHTTEMLVLEDINEIARCLKNIFEKLEILQLNRSISLEYIKQQLVTSQSSGYHIIGGGPLSNYERKDVMKPVALRDLNGVYISGSLAMGEYFSCNIEAPIIAMAIAHAAYIQEMNF